MLKLYKTDLSPPCRAVYLTAAHLGIKLTTEEISLTEMTQLNPEFTEINPQHTVPTLVDDEKVIWDSHAIAVYLCSKYGKDDSLYPNDIHKRAVIDQRLHFDSGVLFPLLLRIVLPIKLKKAKSIPAESVEEVNEAYDFLNQFLEGQRWIAGKSVTLADFSIISTVTSLDALVPINSQKYRNVIAYIKRAQKLPYYHLNEKGVNDFRIYFYHYLTKNNARR